VWADPDRRIRPLSGIHHANPDDEASDGSACLDITCFYGCWNDPPTEAATCSCGAGTAYPCCPMME